MRTFTLLLSVILFSSFSAYGQSSKTKYRGRTPGKTNPWFHVTPVVGIYTGGFQKSISSQGKELDEFQGEGEATTGILIDYNSHRAGFALQSGLVLIKSNAVFQESDNTTNKKIAYVDEYLSIPLAGKFYPFTSSARWLYIRFGVNLSYLMSSNRTTTQTSTSTLVSSEASQSEEVDLTDRRSKADVQALAGLGVIVPISKSIGITLEGNYFHGFINTDKTEGADRQELFSKGISGLLGINFAL